MADKDVKVNDKYVGSDIDDFFNEIYTPEELAIIKERADFLLQIVEARKANNLTQTDLSQKTGIAQSTIAKINSLGIKTTMITGDNEETAKSVAEELGLTNYHANLLPEDKVNINGIIREIKSALEIKLKEHHLELSTRFARLPHIIADEHQITQVLQNLMDNAVKYASDNSVISVITAKINEIPKNRYYEVAEGEAVEISISNSGVTISKEDLNRLTERFYRLQEHKNKNIKGTGLGLSIASQIIKRHRGNLIITSENGLTTFKIYLPLKL